MAKSIALKAELVPGHQLRINYVVGPRNSIGSAGKMGMVFDSKAQLKTYCQSVLASVSDDVLLALALTEWLSRDPTMADVDQFTGRYEMNVTATKF